ncbi:MAG: iron-containing alcohol dehydrogenase [Natrialbaceae archaeon]|nr:iron-containing alcohol dehydrogenase [Natrialbaceae archaeon]
MQYGISNDDGSTLSIIHAFGHGLSRSYPLQQGNAHGVIAPHVLTYLFDRGRWATGAPGQCAGGPNVGDPAQAVIDAVVEVRDELGLPRRLRDVDGPERHEFEAVAEQVQSDSLMANRPATLELSLADIEGVLEAAW